MFQPSSVPVWTAVAAVAGLLQFGALVVTAKFVWRYLTATEALRDSARRQVEVANEQLESQIRPAIVVRSRPPAGVTLVNVGSGPAFDLVTSPAERGATGARRWAEAERYDSFVVDASFVEVGAERNTNIRTQPVAGVGGVPVLAGRSLQCQYRSLSGRTYWTVVDFDRPSGTQIIETRFSVEPL